MNDDIGHLLGVDLENSFSMRLFTVSPQSSERDSQTSKIVSTNLSVRTQLKCSLSNSIAHPQNMQSLSLSTAPFERLVVLFAGTEPLIFFAA